ncbi:hypothetical protein [Rhizobium sp. SL86]|uniref:hypothetical protein n=1 Tax=Rhizobium sp. SL86 TaxID=2995148 RepID=UPI0022747069|nr:hypothetical protein [Rhizobium sp. SL86]MCY1668981.1 hypothetical protein [Rhizobium sp. SL86]
MKIYTLTVLCSLFCSLGWAADAACTAPEQVHLRPSLDSRFESVWTAYAPAKGCIDLKMLIGKSVEITSSRVDKLTGWIGDTLLRDDFNNLVEITPQNARIEVTELGQEHPYRKAVHPFEIRVRKAALASTILDTYWVFRGGEGISPPQAILTDGMSEIVRFTCPRGELSTPRDYGDFSTDRRFEATLKLEDRTPVDWLENYNSRVDGTGRHLGINNEYLGNAIPENMTQRHRSFADSQVIWLGTGATAARNLGAGPAYAALKQSCRVGTSFGSGEADICTRVPRETGRCGGYAEVGTLTRKAADAYAMISERMSLSELKPYWESYANTLYLVRKCRTDNTLDSDCAVEQLERLMLKFEPALPANLSLDETVAPDVDSYPVPDAELLQELTKHGFSAEQLQLAKLVGETLDFSYVLQFDKENRKSDAILIVLHHKQAGRDLSRIMIDPIAAVHDRIGGKVIAPYIVSNRAREQKHRQVTGGQSVKVMHFVEGSRDRHPVPIDQGPRPVAHAVYAARGEIFPDGEIAAQWSISHRGSPAIPEEVIARDILDEEQREKQLQALERRMKEDTERERREAAAAAAKGYIYKSPEFWEKNFTDGDLVRKVFDGKSHADDRLILGWSVAYDDQCRRYLGENTYVFKDSVVTTWRNGYGRVVDRRTHLQEFHVDIRFAAAVDRGRQSRLPAAEALSALNFGGQRLSFDFSRIRQAAEKIAQPYRDSLAIIAAGGCNGPVAQQYHRNLLWSVGQSPSAQQAPFMPRQEVEAITDPPP